MTSMFSGNYAIPSISRPRSFSINSETVDTISCSSLPTKALQAQYVSAYSKPSLSEDPAKHEDKLKESKHAIDRALAVLEDEDSDFSDDESIQESRDSYRHELLKDNLDMFSKVLSTLNIDDDLCDSDGESESSLEDDFPLL